MIEEMQELERTIQEKQDSVNDEEQNDRVRALRRDIRTLTARIKKLRRHIMEKTMGGQVFLVLNDRRILRLLKNSWIDDRVAEEIDYPIFFAVNQKPLKNNKGEYRYRVSANGEPTLDEHGYPVFDEDLDEIGKAFVEFAKEEGLGFWRN